MNTAVYGRRLQAAAREEQAGRRACWPSLKPILDTATATLRANGAVAAQDVDSVVAHAIEAVVSSITSLRDADALAGYVRRVARRTAMRHARREYMVRVDLVKAERLDAEGCYVNQGDLAAARAAREDGRPTPSVRVGRKSVERSIEAPLGESGDSSTYSLADTIPVRDNVAEKAHLEEMMDWAREATTPRRFEAWQKVRVLGWTNGEVAEVMRGATPNGVAQLVRAAMADFAAKSGCFPFAA